MKEQIMTQPQKTWSSADEIDSGVFSPDFSIARDAIRTAIAESTAAGAPDATTLAALMAETLPRLVNAYGPQLAAVILARLAHDIGAGLAPLCRPQ
jgi:hypothetical protein